MVFRGLVSSRIASKSNLGSESKFRCYSYELAKKTVDDVVEFSDQN